jgi:hypothetical protein
MCAGDGADYCKAFPQMGCAQNVAGAKVWFEKGQPRAQVKLATLNTNRGFAKCFTLH